MAWTEKLPSGKYSAVYRLPSGEKRRAGNFPHKRAALAAATKAEEDAATPGWKDPRAAARSWGEWNREWWPTRDISAANDKNERSMLKRIDERWAKVPLAEIDHDSVKRWASALRDDGLEATSVNRTLAVFRTSLSAAVSAGVIQSNPALRTNLRVGEKERIYLTREEAAALIEALPSERDKQMVSFMFGTGVRFGEAAGLQIQRLAPDLSSVRIIETWLINQKTLSQYPKSRALRTVPIPGWVAERLEPLTKVRKSGFVFPGDRSPAVSHSSFLKRVKNAARDAEIGKEITPHTTRHSYASWLVQGGIPMARVSRLLGHRSVNVTDQIYAHLAPEDGDDLMDTLGVL